MAGAMSAIPWRLNGTGRAIRTATLRQLERRGLVALADGEYRITDAGLQLIRVRFPAAAGDKANSKTLNMDASEGSILRVFVAAR
jgi:ribosomal protein S19E (S16A)